jgi:hypothetical protein
MGDDQPAELWICIIDRILQKAGSTPSTLPSTVSELLPFTAKNGGAWSYVFSSVLDTYGSQLWMDGIEIRNALGFFHEAAAEVEIFLRADVLRIVDSGVFTPCGPWKIITRIDPTTRLLDPRLVLHPIVVPDLADACLQGMEIDLGEDFVEDSRCAMSTKIVQCAIADIERGMLALTTRNATLEDKRIF